MRHPPVEQIHLGRISWADAMTLQLERWEAVVQDQGAEAIFTLEHDPTISVGRRGNPGDILVSDEDLQARGITVVQADRGGEITYHGPGQLVLYAVLNIGKRGIAVGDLVRKLSAAAAEVLATWGIEANYDPKHPGLWTRDAKIGAVGMRVKKNVSMHGMAINLSTRLDAFSLIVPCGMPQARTTSVAEWVSTPPSLEEFGDQLAQAAATKLGLTLQRGHKIR